MIRCGSFLATTVKKTKQERIEERKAKRREEELKKKQAEKTPPPLSAEEQQAEKQRAEEAQRESDLQAAMELFGGRCVVELHIHCSWLQPSFPHSSALPPSLPLYRSSCLLSCLHPPSSSYSPSFLPPSLPPSLPHAVSGGRSIDRMNPSTPEEFDEFQQALVKKITEYEVRRSPHSISASSTFSSSSSSSSSSSFFLTLPLRFLPHPYLSSPFHPSFLPPPSPSPSFPPTPFFTG